MIDKHTPLKFVADKDQRLVGDDYHYKGYGFWFDHKDI